MTDLYDVIIIGAGVSGSSCAYNIKRYNPQAKVLLLDKAEFPRYKPCGGGVSPEVQNYLDFDLSPAIDLVCDEVIMIANQHSFSSNKFPLWMVRREKFDNYLLQKAKDKGVEFRANTEVVELKQQLNSVFIITKNGEFEAKIAVIAEGGLGKLAQKLGLAGKNTILAAMEYEHYTSKLDNKLYIDFDYNENGYAWNFPKSDGLSFGIGGFFKGRGKNKASLPQKLRQYLQKFDVAELDKKHLHGHPILLYSGKQKLVQQNILLIGEIAGCVDPLTAEGIRPAIKSGYLAAQVIAQALKQQNLAMLKQYTKDFQREIGHDFKYARIMSYFLNTNLTKVLPMLANSHSVNGFMQVFSGQSSYRAKITWRRIVKLMWKKIC